MVSNALWGFIIANVLASIYNLSIIGTNATQRSMTIVWGALVVVCIAATLQLPPGAFH